MMNTIFKSSVTENRKQTDAEKSFAAETERLKASINAIDFSSFKQLPLELENQEKRFLLLLVPLIDVAWADGSINLREFDAVLQVADVYGLLDDKQSFSKLMQYLTRQITPGTRKQFWLQLEKFFEHLPASERITVERCLLVQAQFVAERSSGNFLNFQFDTSVCEREQSALQQLASKLRHIIATKQAAIRSVCVDANSTQPTIAAA